MLTIPLFSLALFLTALLTLALAIYGWVNRPVRGAHEFALLMTAVTFYVAGYGMEILSSGEEGILFWLKVQYLGIAVIPVACLLVAVRLTNRDHWFESWIFRIVVAMPLLILLLYFTNPLHLLFYKSVGALSQNGPFYMLEIEKGPVYYINIAFLNLSMLCGVILFILNMRVDRVARKQAAIMILGSVGPWLGLIVYQIGFTKGLDTGPFGFVITAPLFAWGIFANQMVYLLPKARNSVYTWLGDAIIILDHKHAVIDFNPSARDLFGLSDKRLRGKSFEQVFAPFQQLVSAINNIADDRQQIEITIKGEARNFSLNHSRVKSLDNSQNLGLVMVLHEITGELKLTDELRESEERFRMVFEHTPVGIFHYDNQACIRICNDSFVEIIGSTREKLIGLDMKQLPDERIKNAVSRSLKGEMDYYEGEYHSVTASKVTPVRAFFGPVFGKDNQSRGGVGIVEDFTERFSAEQSLKYRDQFEAIMIELAIRFLSAPLEEMEVTFNEGLAKLGEFCGVDRAYIFRFEDDLRLMSNTHEWCSPETQPEISNLQHLSVDLVPAWMSRLKRSEIIYIPDLSQLDSEWAGEKAILEPQGVKSLIVVPVAMNDELLGFTGFDSVRAMRNWTKDEIALLQILGRLFASVIKRKEGQNALLLAKNMAEEANRVKSVFLANMSHEIRTPLNGILGFAELLMTDFEDDEVRRYAEVILSSGNRLLQTLSQILDLSRIEAGKMELYFERINVLRAIQELVDLFNPSAQKKGLYLELSPESVDVVLDLDDQLFRSSIGNLINNAIKFTNKGGVRISTQFDETDGMRFATIRVEDTGIGIDPAFHELIFDDFRQVSEGIRRSYEGTGLGLSLTRKFVLLCGGTIHLESRPGEGTTFILRFPVED